VDIERRQNSPKRQGISMPARLAIGALAIFGVITMVQWVIGALLGVIKFGLVVVVVVAVGAWVVGAKGSR
jgi:Flp pilus assembly protein TadB